jgi:hypothetical protein
MGGAYEGEDRCIQGVREERCGKETAWDEILKWISRKRMRL